MKILLCSYLYDPSIGGIETMSALLVREWTQRGHDVQVVTGTPGPVEVGGQKILRSPGMGELWRVVKWCDVCVHNNISMRWAWAPVLACRPWVVVHQTWLQKQNGHVGWQEHLKRVSLRAAHSVAISRAVSARLPSRSEVIPNAYDDEVFSLRGQENPRPRDLVFVGRLVSDKGGDVLVDALACLAKTGVRPNLTMIGEGPERRNWQVRAEAAGVGAQLRWTGALRGHALAEELRKHRIMVVPSRWAEPFGIVALEGAACGCIVVGSQEGGLPDAIGPCGTTFANGDATALARRLAEALEERAAPDAGAWAAHLARHRAGTVAERYLALFAEVLS